jgi:hypothetical protein
MSAHPDAPKNIIYLLSYLKKISASSEYVAGTMCPCAGEEEQKRDSSNSAARLSNPVTFGDNVGLSLRS